MRKYVRQNNHTMTISKMPLLQLQKSHNLNHIAITVAKRNIYKKLIFYYIIAKIRLTERKAPLSKKNSIIIEYEAYFLAHQ